MEKGKFNIILHSISSIILAVILLISTSYAWYTSNKDVSASGDNIAISSENIDVYKYYVFKEEIIDTPYPARDANVPEGIINGESIYLSVSIKDVSNDTEPKDLFVSLRGIDGGEFFKNEENDFYTDSEGKLYNMCDLYTIKFHSSWGTNEDGTYYIIKSSDENEPELAFDRKNAITGEQITTISEMDIYTYTGWETANGEITLVFEMKFNTSPLEDASIPADVAATKYMTFGQIVVIAKECDQTQEEGNE